MKKFTLLLLVILITTLSAFVVAGPTIVTKTELWNFVNGIQINGTVSLSDTVGDSGTVLPKNSIGGDELTGVMANLIYCGQAAENGTIYLSPAAGVNAVTIGARPEIASATCDGLDGGTEATQDLVIFPQSAFKVLGMWCMSNGTLGASETATFTFRSAAADVTPSVTCTIIEAQTECAAMVGTTTNVAAGAATAVKADEVSNNSDDDFWCQVSIMLR